MGIKSISEKSNPDQLRGAINWQAGFPDYVFREKKIRGFFVVGSGIFATRDFLEFLLGESLEINNSPLSVLIRLHGGTAQDLFFSASKIDEIRDLRLQLTQSPADLFGSKVVVSGAPSRWVAYEEVNESFALLAVFDDEIFERWSSSSSAIGDYVLSKDKISEILSFDEWPGWDPAFLKNVLDSYGGGQD